MYSFITTVYMLQDFKILFVFLLEHVKDHNITLTLTCMTVCVHI